MTRIIMKKSTFLRNHSLLAVGASLLLLLPGSGSAATTLLWDFESPAYTAGTNNLSPQDGWAIQFGQRGSVQPYSGGLVAWTPSSAGSQQLYAPPVPNPYGGLQYVGKSIVMGGGSGGGREIHAAVMGPGVVSVRVDIINGPEHDFPNYQGAINSRNAANGNLVGIYTSSASTFVESAVPRRGNWAYAVHAFNSAGTQVTAGYSPFYRLSGQEGFNDLPRQTWWRLGYSYDTVTRRVTQLFSKNLITGQKWILNNPLGPIGEDLYIHGGSTGTSIPDIIGLYNVGNGQVHLFDNVTVSDVALPDDNDVTLPLWTSGWPQASGACGFTLKAKLNEPGTVYYVVLANGASAPSSADVRAGTGAIQNGSLNMIFGTNSGPSSLNARVWDATAESTASLVGLTGNTDYDVWFVGEDLAGNLQASPVKVDVFLPDVDVTPPVWAATYPKITPVTPGGFTLRAQTDEASTAFYVVLADGSPAPTSAAVRAGSGAIQSGSMVLAAGAESTAAIAGLVHSTAYDVWVVVEDCVPNLQASPAKVDVTTPAPPYEPYTADANTVHLWHFDEPLVLGHDNPSRNFPVDAPGVIGPAWRLDNSWWGGVNLPGGVMGGTGFVGFGLAGQLDHNVGGDNRAWYDFRKGGGNPAAPGGTVGADITATQLLGSDSGAFTIEGLFKWDGGASGNLFKGSANGGGGDDGNSVLRVRLLTPGTSPTFEIGLPNGGSFTTTAGLVPALNTNNWYHMALTFAGNNAGGSAAKFYWTKLDLLSVSAEANLVASNNSTSITTYDIKAFTIGNWNGGNFDGFVDEFRISNVARAADAMLFRNQQITFTSVSYDPNNDQLTLKWNSTSGATYTIENTQVFVGNGVGTSWDNLTTGIASGGSTTSQVIDAPAPGTFYRIRKE